VTLIAVGLLTGIVRSSALPLGGKSEELLFASLSDMVVFTAFFGAAIRFRRRPQIQRRLMIVAATTLLIAAVARMPFVPPPPHGLPLFMAIWCSPIAVAMAYDLWSGRGVHYAYVAGLAAFAARIALDSIAGTPAWGAFAAWVRGFVTSIGAQ
jgi:hypothetical protein